MPNRIIHESICSSETLGKISGDEERMFWRLVVIADDYGRIEGRLHVLRARCFQETFDRIAPDDVERWVAALVDAQLVARYEVAGRPYLQILSWAAKQRVRNARPKYPPPPDACKVVPLAASRRASPPVAALNGSYPDPIQSDLEALSKTAPGEAGTEQQLAAAAGGDGEKLGPLRSLMQHTALGARLKAQAAEGET